MRKSVKVGAIGFLVGCLAVAGAAAGLWQLFGLGFVERRIAETLAEQGMPVSALTLRSVGTDRAVMTDLRFELAGGVAIHRIEAEYRLAELLWDRRLDRLVLSGLRIDMSVPESGSAMLVEGAAPEWPAAGLPVGSIVVQDGEIAFPTPIGKLGLTVDLEALALADGDVAVSGRTRIRGAAGEVGMPFAGGIAPDGTYLLTVMPEAGSLVWGGVVLESPEGIVTVTGTVADAPLIDAELAVDIALPDGSSARLGVLGRLAGDSGTLDLGLAAADGQSRIGLSAELNGLDGPSPAFDLAMGAEMPLLEPLAALVGAADADWMSTGALKASLSGYWDRLPDSAAAPVAGRLVVEADLASADSEERLTVAVASDLQADAGMIRLKSDDEARFTWQPNGATDPLALTLGSMAGDAFDVTLGAAGDGWALTAAGPFLMAEGQGKLSGMVNVTASGSESETGAAGRIAAEIAASGSLPGVATVEGGRAELSGRFAVGDGRWRFETDSCQPVAADRLEIGAVMTLPNGISACWLVMPEPPLPDSAATPPDDVTVAATIRIDPVAIVLGTGAVDGLRFELDALETAITTRFDAVGDVSADITSPQAVFRLADETMALDGLLLSLEAAADDPALRISLDSATLRSLRTPEPIVPLGIAGDAVWGEDDLLTFGATIRGAAGALMARVEGRHDVAAGAGSADIRLDPVSFAPGVRQPADIVPALATDLGAELTGSLSASGRVDWRGTLSSSGELRVEGLTLTNQGAAVRDIEGILRADSLFPLNLPDGQLLAIGSADLGLALEEGAVAFGLAGDRLSVQGIGFSLANGSLAAEPFQIGPEDRDVRMVVTMQGVELGLLSAQFPVEGLTVTGRLDGELPIRLFDDTMSIDNGVLETTEPGVIQYTATLPVGPPGEGGVGLLIGAVRNFEYQGLRATLNGKTGDDLEVAVRLTGANPDLYDGYPIALNINLSGDLEQVLRSGLKSMAIAEDAGSLLRGN